MNKTFQLNFLGVVDSSSRTLDSLRELFTNNFGLNDEQIDTIFLSAPVTLIESTNKEELLPIYDFLKSASAKVIIEESSEEQDLSDKENDEDIEEDSPEFDLSEDEDAEPEVEKVVEAPKATKLADSEEIVFDFDTEDSKPEVEEVKPEVVKPKKVEEEITVFSFDDTHDAQEEVAPSAPEPKVSPKTNNASEEKIELTFKSDDDTPDLNSVNSAKLISEGITASPDAPLKSNALKLNFDIKPKDQAFLENLKKQQEEAKVEFKDEEIELKDGPVLKSEALASTGFDNIIHKSSHNTAESFRPRKQLINKEIWQYLIPILIGCTFVLVGSIMILPSQEEPKQAARTTKESPEASSTTTPTNKVSVTRPINSKYYGKSQDQNMLVEGTLTRYSNELKNISLTISPPPPQALTPEDLVLNKKLPPWIEKLTIDQLKLNPSKDDDSFLGISKARIYVNYNNQKYRLIVPVAVRAVLKKDWNLVRVAVIMKAGIKDPPDTPYFVEIVTNGQHKIYLKSIFEASEVMEETTSTAKVTTEEKPTE